MNRLSLPYGTYWAENMSEQKWSNFHNFKGGMHLHFDQWCKNHWTGWGSDTVLEIGCGYGGQARMTFQGQDYTGIDLSSNGIDLATSKNEEPKHHFICGDVMKKQLPQFDFVFSINVIDHVPDPNAFIDRALELARKQLIIYSYHGYDETNENHIISVNSTNDCFLNTLSIKELKRRYDCDIEKFDCGEGQSMILRFTKKE